MNQALIVAGTFDENGGQASRYARRLFSSVLCGLRCKVHFINGGYIKDLTDALSIVENSDVVIWMPNLDNKYTKFLPLIKKLNYKTILVSSKANFSEKYTNKVLIARMLKHKANLCLVLNGDPTRIRTELLDPLGNTFAYTTNIDKVASRLLERLDTLTDVTRIGSKCIDSEPKNPENDKLPQFINIIHEFSDRFHKLIHAANQDRFLGNISFRCENGFPSFKQGQYLFVSRRNIDKRGITEDDFVCTTPLLDEHNRIEKIGYYGQNKPSVDTPIQLELSQYYTNVNYIIHSHVYGYRHNVNPLEQMTERCLPCGALEEADEIIKVEPDKEASNFFVNLKGHGSIILSEDLSYFNDISFISRPTPELICEKPNWDKEYNTIRYP